MSLTIALLSRSIGNRDRKIKRLPGRAYEIIVRAGEKAQIDPSQIARVEPGIRSSTGCSRHLPHDRWLKPTYRTMTNARVPSPSVSPPADDLCHLIREAILEIAARGSAVIVAHAASFALPQTERSPLTVLSRLGELRAAGPGKKN